MKFLICITGASGSLLADRVIDRLMSQGHEVSIILSKTAKRVVPFELDNPNWELSLREKGITFFEDDNLFSIPASGSVSYDAYIVVPCSMGTLGRIAGGISDTLLTRVCDVAIKERRKLILVVRETPLSSIHLENMLKLSNLGAIILPPVPAYYNKPKTLDDLHDATVSRILSLAGIKLPLKHSWLGEDSH